MDNTSYFKALETSKGHTPIYKMHKYFARRPHNVFRAIIEHYSKRGDIILDPFAGGGVTVVEGLTAHRRVIACDVNPIASFIQFAQVLDISPANFVRQAGVIKKRVHDAFGCGYRTHCRQCDNSQAHVRWFEHAYRTMCPSCNAATLLSNDKLFSHEDKETAGKYVCQHCSKPFRSVSTPRIGSELVSLRYRCHVCGAHENAPPQDDDRQLFHGYCRDITSLSRAHATIIPNDDIPLHWDRQHEDCLHRKGITKFRDLFTPRNLLTSAYFFTVLDSMPEISPDERYFHTFIISSLLRYTNNMNFSTSTWMDGRPVAWAKHAYWLPNQFIETNPLEYYDNRIKAALSGLKDQQSRFTHAKSGTIADVTNQKATHSIQCIDSSRMDLPDNSISLVITDPPYGSNVQYAELCEFWRVWLKDRFPFGVPEEHIDAEAVVHRRTDDTSYAKTFDFYRKKLTDIFKESYRVLKPGGHLVFTFNNKDARAWYSVIAAAIDAGFLLEPDGIVFQGQIHAYRDTAHLRYDGTPQGDYIYSFRKDTSLDGRTVSAPHDFDSCFSLSVNHFRTTQEPIALDQFMVRLFAYAVPSLVKAIRCGNHEEEALREYSTDRVKAALNSYPHLNKSGEAWVHV